jgi:hypothetical protein
MYEPPFTAEIAYPDEIVALNQLAIATRSSYDGHIRQRHHSAIRAKSTTAEKVRQSLHSSKFYPDIAQTLSFAWMTQPLLVYALSE